MEVTENDVACIPVSNLRVARADFAAVWTAAERLNKEQAARVSQTGTPVASW